MKGHAKQIYRRFLAYGLASLALAVWSNVALAQQGGGLGGRTAGGGVGALGQTPIGGAGIGGSSVNSQGLGGGIGGSLGGGLGAGGLSGGSGGGGLGGGGLGGGMGGGSFSGSTSFGGGTGAGSFSGTTRLGGGSGGVSTANAFSSYYVNPLSYGLPSGARATFGSPLYNITSGTSLGGGLGGGLSGGLGGGLSGGLGGRLGGGLSGGLGGGLSGGLTGSLGAGGLGTNRMGAMGGINQGMLRSSNPPALVNAPPRTSPLIVRTDLQQALGQYTALPSREGIQVLMDGPTVVLKGPVSGDYERRLAEMMVRLRPGVGNVRNELQVPEVAPPPRPKP